MDDSDPAIDAAKADWEHELEIEGAAAKNALIDSRNAHHEAGHAIAVVYCGGYVEGIHLSDIDHSKTDAERHGPGYGRYRYESIDKPFIDYAGPWAETHFVIANGVESEDFETAFMSVWNYDNATDNTNYFRVAHQVRAYAASQGIRIPANVWEEQWNTALERLLPAIRRIADDLLSGKKITHEYIRQFVRRSPR